jgi:hypothetical protein
VSIVPDSPGLVTTPRRAARRRTIDERVARWYKRSVVIAENGCHVWTGATTRNGYGQVRLTRDQPRMAHRAIYEATRGAIPASRDLDHLCRNRACVNPAHLEPVSRSENLRRGWAASPRPDRTHCKRGHEFTTENTRFTPDGRRSCRACVNLLARERRASRGTD